MKSVPARPGLSDLILLRQGCYRITADVVRPGSHQSQLPRPKDCQIELIP
jgi:hypothetical protein